jgi:hypothetical protein
MRYWLAAIQFLTLLPGCIHAQVGNLESPRERIETPSLEKETRESMPFDFVQSDELGRLDSLQMAAKNSLNKFTHSYDSVARAAQRASKNLQHSIDSLSDLNLPTGKLG